MLTHADRRVKLLRELARIVRRGGRMLVYAWSIEQVLTFLALLVQKYKY
jgi:hypothetical protein